MVRKCLTFITLNQREEHHLTTSSVNLNFTGKADIEATLAITKKSMVLADIHRWASCVKALNYGRFAVINSQIVDDHCCANESRNMNGGCDNCGDPCL